MILIHKAELLEEYLKSKSVSGLNIGFIPTMGALHEGHTELIKQSLTAGNHTVCSIFVNPTQFNNATDFARYPKTLEADIEKLKSVGTDVLFIPDVTDIYPDGVEHLEWFNLGYLETILEGSSRPGHFQGVCQVMKRLLTIVNPHSLFMGQKDYQQCMVVNWLLQKMKSSTQLITVPTIRQRDGLALSSRNLRLSAEGLNTAASIFETLNYVKRALSPGDLTPLLSEAERMLKSRGFSVDYIETAIADTLELTRTWDGRAELVCLVAAFIEDVRLIDNLIVTAQPVDQNK